MKQLFRGCRTKDRKMSNMTLTAKKISEDTFYKEMVGHKIRDITGDMAITYITLDNGTVLTHTGYRDFRGESVWLGAKQIPDTTKIVAKYEIVRTFSTPQKNITLFDAERNEIVCFHEWVHNYKGFVNPTYTIEKQVQQSEPDIMDEHNYFECDECLELYHEQMCCDAGESGHRSSGWHNSHLKDYVTLCDECYEVEQEMFWCRDCFDVFVKKDAHVNNSKWQLVEYCRRSELHSSGGTAKVPYKEICDECYAWKQKKQKE
jgi:hypothetical protein